MAAEQRLVQYWHSEEIPDEIADLLRTFEDRNPELRHRVFSRSEAEELIAERFTAREVEAFRACSVPAMQADYFRYCAVLALGGVYSDADFRCVGDLGPLLPPAGQGRLFAGSAGNVINSLFAFGSPGHAFLELVLEIATANVERRISDRVYYTTGPPILTVLVALRQWDSFEGFLERIDGPEQQRIARAYCETIGSPERVNRALEAVEVSAAEERDRFVQPADSQLQYKRSATHWTKVSWTTFR